MKNKIIRSVGIAVMLCLWLGLAITAWLRPSDEISISERRQLAQFPAFSGQSILDGDFMSEFENYTLDQFPLRDQFRKLKAWFQYEVLNQKDNNGIFISQGYAAQVEYPLNENSVKNAVKKFNELYETYMKDSGSTVFTAVIPDKNYYLSRQDGGLAMDYEALFSLIREGMPYSSYVNLTDSLMLEDYYYTDTHWRQERLLLAAQKLCEAMGISTPKMENYTVTTATETFFGVYYGQAALPMDPETLYILESDMLADCKVYNYETNMTTPVYDLEKLDGNDPYDVYLSGAAALLTIENPNSETDRELIVFRDSFGSSMIPLLVQGYERVTVVDTRYIAGSTLGEFIDFHGQDVLFLYSTLVLNNSYSMK